jgi:hypothetical protein
MVKANNTGNMKNPNPKLNRHKKLKERGKKKGNRSSRKGKKYNKITYRSDPRTTTSRLTPKYLPFPHPTSNPTLPLGREVRNFSTMGQGLYRV